MKKQSKLKQKKSSVRSKGGADIADIIVKMQEQLTFLDKKMDNLVDILIRQISARAGEVRPSPKPFQQHQHQQQPHQQSQIQQQRPQQQPAQPHHHGERRQDNHFRGRVLHKAICADCKKDCEIPFQPSPGRPVYCKACFSVRKGGNSQKERPNYRPGPVQITPVAKPQVVEKKRIVEKKKPTGKRRK
ncbi:MAG: hypothetical protein A3G33_01140 [Omnitrophica bacterium RIFCSPLOWO2_12_FULL_44_17]|uniref:CxxC-x17-CxxC domain-containing protein n=1 Tax=Candidatus Danuiimicrobium aquiferis TaxID=1801832 RepID=A0A1G1L0Y3_9BACT|nr:MAG: hypothetical protein A3B72_02455 [Omnitrophica bacterium RIFCSPHIGHO2_02_FULL_45_28]OGW98794.1 MAG: hypothetical protein A3G33_01140 [Omnitrophica bacterium RIFCSPLOWO2_12_FULL_44_17]OGX02500.1 MAG: hypothetical protein A3J12_00250 [Omnitrophica bacterium RIFCSPLOWO2_02_FULL_44_11]